MQDNSTMLIEAAKGGHTNVVQLLLDYPHSIMMSPPHPPAGLHEVPEAVRVLPQEESPFSTKPAAIAGKLHNNTKITNRVNHGTNHFYL